MKPLDYVSCTLLLAALFFFVAGTVGLLRLPDLYSRLHALTKADNVALGLTVLALLVQAESWHETFKLGVIWVLVTVASATVCYLVSSEALRRGKQPWTRRGDDSDGF
jgi:multicomponent Na+:H+ antiporter subunit G